MEKYEGKVSVKIIVPHENDIAIWCRDQDCSSAVLDHIDHAISSIPMLGTVAEKDIETLEAIKRGRDLLHPSVLIDDRVPELLLVSNFVSKSFAEEFDLSLELRRHLSQALADHVDHLHAFRFTFEFSQWMPRSTFTATIRASRTRISTSLQRLRLSPNSRPTSAMPAKQVPQQIRNNSFGSRI